MALSLLQQERRLAYYMLCPSFLIVFIITIFPILANVWFSFKPLQLANLRKADILVTEQIRRRPSAVGEELLIRLVLRNSSASQSINNVNITIAIPDGLQLQELPPLFEQKGQELIAQFPLWEPTVRQDFILSFRAKQVFLASPIAKQQTILNPVITGTAPNPLIFGTLNLDNYQTVIQSDKFFPTLAVTVIYSAAAAFGALLLGLIAALLIHSLKHSRGIITTLLLFPYIAPIIALALSWVFLLDPFSGTVNHLLIKAGWIKDAIPFLSKESFVLFGINFPLALSAVIGFSSWRYFPLMFLFILARLQAIPTSLYEAARVDGSGSISSFFRITLPLLAPVMTTMYLIRFMWNFNKFDDIFLLTGGAAGTRTLPIDIYVQAFALGNIGTGAAVAMLLFLFLALFLLAYTRYKPDTDI